MPYQTPEARRVAYYKNPEPKRIKQREYNASHKEQIKATKLRHRVTPLGRARDLIFSAKKRATDKQIEFSITREWIQQKIENGVCELSGLPFVLVSGTQHHPYAPSIDKINPLNGYTTENCRVIFWCLNTALGSWGEEASIKAWKAVIARRECDGKA